MTTVPRSVSVGQMFSRSKRPSFSVSREIGVAPSAWMSRLWATSPPASS
jgi:hypothetical protein